MYISFFFCFSANAIIEFVKIKWKYKMTAVESFSNASRTPVICMLDALEEPHFELTSTLVLKECLEKHLARGIINPMGVNSTNSSVTTWIWI